MPMSVSAREVKVVHDGVACAGLLAWDGNIAEPRPGILIAPTIRGRTDFEEQKARELAAAGYVALVIDLYGEATRDSDLESKRDLMNGFRADRDRLLSRLLAWHEGLAAMAEVDAARTAAIGFCFGGLCVLDLARAGIALVGAVSFHGILTPPPQRRAAKTGTRTLVLHGWDDPLAPPADVLALAEELTSIGSDWQLHAYGHTVHAFTNPAASDSVAGTVYNRAADRRSYAAMQAFLAELFAD